MQGENCCIRYSSEQYGSTDVCFATLFVWNSGVVGIVEFGVLEMIVIGNGYFNATLLSTCFNVYPA
ncbi:hypothetical protein SLEP1_g2459 [Rubroshorea leprosula]|uniref:Uncharacterized protein n=1 Tax=Rubroshorea leprosula TaxID=152421 RepID=A0AAV5HRE5_9ROSI|nr:hypothetical protein SLEP1_g2454 [Rubroshorea leprosula]GKU88162.1 hypothetical protein SLEP1_g2459 [Rubroshorea leprosula]